MFPWLLNVYMNAVMKDVKMRMRRRGESRDCLGSCMLVYRNVCVNLLDINAHKCREDDATLFLINSDNQ